MSKTLITISALALAMCATFFALSYLQETGSAKAAIVGLPAAVSTTSTMVIGPSTSYNAALGSFMGTSSSQEKTNLCASRVISTNNTPIMVALSSSASTTLSGSVGNWQGASTTVGYDSGLYGCGYWTFYAYATTTITVTQTR